MKHLLSIMLATSALCGGAITAAHAADAPDSSQPALSGDDSAEIVVNARRKPELLLDVPQTIDAVKGRTLEQLNLFEFTDLTKVVAGLTLDPTDEGISMRGVSFNATVQTNPTASTYIDEAPVQSALIFESLFDIGQIEVLKGPQGTTRGQSAPTGAITLTTRRPDLDSFGGYALGSASDQDARNLQGALNVPLIAGKLAIRVAGDIDHTNNGGIASVNSPTSPYSETDAFRVSVRAEPINDLSINASYQHLTNNNAAFGLAGTSDYGSGSPGAAVDAQGYASAFVPTVGYNGPVIPIGTRLNVAEQPDVSRTQEQLATAQIDYTTDQFKLSYIGSWQHIRDTDIHPGDTGNQVLGDFPGRDLANTGTRWTHELRISSVQRIAGFADVTAGIFHLSERDQTTGLTDLAAFFPGAFGSPTGAPTATSPNLQYALPIDLAFLSHNSEWSYYGNVTLHLDSKTELTGGVRFIHDSRYNYQDQLASNPYAGAAIPSAYCAGAGGIYATNYPGVCDIPIPVPASVAQNNQISTPVVYSATLSHHFTPALMAYFNFGTSWRPGFVQSSIVNISNDPLLSSLANLKDETSKSYEVGLKGSAFDHRLNASIAYYHQIYSNFVLSQPSAIPYLISAGGSTTLSALYSLNSNVNAIVDGIDMSVDFRIASRWSVNADLSWANGRFKNQLVPCDAPIPSGQLIAECQTNGNAGTAPDWNMTIRSDYSHKLTNDLDGFISGILTYSPKNPNYDHQYTVSAYALINLNVGIRSPVQGWELQAFVKNLTNNATILDKSTLDLSSVNGLGGYFGASGYSTIIYQNPREFGVTFRYAFGSR